MCTESDLLFVMTRKVICVAEDTPLAEIADIFDTRGIGRVPVVDGRQLVGIVTRADLLKTIAAQKAVPSGQATHSDDRPGGARVGPRFSSPVVSWSSRAS